MGDFERPSDGDVIDLSGARAISSSASVGRIERYWSEVRGDRLVPTRADIDPRGLTGVLSNAFILERIATGLARFRIAGAHLGELAGVEVRGMPLSAIFVPEARETLSDAVAAAFDDPSIIRLSLASESGFGRAALSGALVLLPLRSDLGEVSRILGGISMHGEIGRTRRKLSITGQARQGLTGRGGPEARTESLFADPPAAPRKDAPRPERRDNVEGSHLKLVVDNEQT